MSECLQSSTFDFVCGEDCEDSPTSKTFAGVVETLEYKTKGKNEMQTGEERMSMIFTLFQAKSVIPDRGIKPEQVVVRNVVVQKT